MNKINFQNGTLVSKAKVTINGTVYEVEPAEYEGTTPLNAENLNQIQTNVENAIPPVVDNLTSTSATDALSANQGKVLNEKMTGTILYSDSTGTKGDVTLSESVSNYNYLKIFYKSGVRSSSIEIEDYTNKDIALTIVVTSETTFVLISKQIRISGNTITKVGENQVLYHITNGYQFSQTDSMYIYKVIGYK